jgi:drug/metabolite transporter (DMT)-like permease
MLLALTSAATFGVSGPIAKSLLAAGWSPLAVVLLRIGGGALTLAIPAVIVLRRQSRPTSPGSRPLGGRDAPLHRRRSSSPLSRRGWTTMTLYGVFAIAGVQLGYFNAVQTLSVGVAMLLEYLAPVLLLGFVWWRTGSRPSLASLVGAAVALVGLVFVIDVFGGVQVDPRGMAWGLFAALCLACYFQLSARAGDELHPVVMAAGGCVVGFLAMAVVALLGLLPVHASTATTLVLGHPTSWLVPALVLILVSTAAAYLTGILGVQRLGSRVASFVGLTEVLFAVLWAWLLLSELPTVVQLFGGLLVTVGVILVRTDRRLT